MTNKALQTRGFTLVEILLVITILSIAAVLMVVAFRNFASFQQYNKAVADVEFLLNQTRLSAKSAEGDVSHGIKFYTSSITTFSDLPFNVSDPENQTYNYNLITIETNLTDAVDEIVFDKLSGLPSATGTIIVHGVNYSASTTIEISDTGVIE